MEKEENYEPQALRIEDKNSGQDEGVTIAYLSAGIDLSSMGEEMLEPGK